MQELLTLNPENATPEEVADYKVREAVRAVVMNSKGEIALLFVAKENYYKLPGGGIEKGEDKMTALQRECREEIGTEVEVKGEIGTIVENRKIFHIKQTSDCYLAAVRGRQSAPQFTDDEKANDFRVTWKPYEEALQLMQTTQSTAIEAYAYIVPRDVMFLKTAQPVASQPS